MLAEYAVNQGSGSLGAHRAASYGVEETSDFRLENHHQGNGTYIDEGAEYGGGHLHVQQTHKHAQQQQRNDCEKDVHCGGALEPTEENIDNRCNHQDVQDVRKVEMKKAYVDKQSWHNATNLAKSFETYWNTKYLSYLCSPLKRTVFIITIN